MPEKNGLHKLKCLNAAHLKIIAMVCMLLDHMWITVIDGNAWMTALGRIAFPIFAFQIAEGYAHTKDFKRYLLRMFLFALVSELPFNFMTGGWWLNPVHQNVMFTFCLALILIWLIDKARTKHWGLGLAATVIGAIVGYIVGMITFVDYYGCGILMVLVFWLFRDVKFGWLIQFAALLYINTVLLGGRIVTPELFGIEFRVPLQAFAMAAFVPIWLYNGKQGTKSKVFQYVGYAFYPVHMILLVLIAILF